MPELRLDGRTAYCGNGGAAWDSRKPTAVLIHGAGCDHTVWALQARSLAHHGWNVAVPDLPGHGATADRDRIYTIEDHADWVLALIADLRESGAGNGEFALAGHSMGACIAFTAAAKAGPADVRGVALFGAGATLRVHPGLLADSLKRPLAAHRFIAAFGHGSGAHFGAAESPGLWMLGATMALLDRCSPEVLHRDFAACNEWEGADHAAAVRVPVSIVAGDRDRMTPPRAGKALADQVSAAGGRVDFLTIPDTGHMLMAEAPGVVTRSLRSFLAAD